MSERHVCAGTRSRTANAPLYVNIGGVLFTQPRVSYCCAATAKKYAEDVSRKFDRFLRDNHLEPVADESQGRGRMGGGTERGASPDGVGPELCWCGKPVDPDCWKCEGHPDSRQSR